MKPAALLLVVALAACGDEPDRGYAATAGGARQEPYAAVPPGSVPRGTAERLRAVAAPGPPVTPALLAAGRRAYLGRCAPCHGADGRGDGPVVEKGYPRPLPFAAYSHDAAEIVAIVTRGKGQMPSMADQVPPIERWAIARFLTQGAEGISDAR